MPSRNIIKEFIPKGFYHVYNRGINKDNIFCEKDDYVVFMNCLKTYLLTKEEIVNEIDKKFGDEKQIKKGTIDIVEKLKNFNGVISLSCFCLMPNHFHFLIRQEKKDSISKFMRGLLTRYSLYFNRKYKRMGPLYQSRYKGVLVKKDEYLLHLSRYIHANPTPILNKGKKLEDYQWSSYKEYLNLRKIKWVDTAFINSYFNKNVKGRGVGSYRGFMEGYEFVEGKVDGIEHSSEYILE